MSVLPSYKNKGFLNVSLIFLALSSDKITIIYILKADILYNFLQVLQILNNS